MTHPLCTRVWRPLAAAIVAALLLPAVAGAADVVPGEVIVRYAVGSSAAERADVRADTGTRAIEGLGMARAQLLDVTDGDSVAATVRQLEADPDVAYAEPNYIRRLALLPNDPQFLNGNQWGLYNDGQTVNGFTGTPDADIDAPEAWNIATGNISTVVAVMDTGADLQHPDLAPELWTNTADPANGVDDDGNGIIDDVNGADFIGDSFDEDVPGSAVPDGDPTDLSGHGSHVSGIALAEGNNGIGVTGVSWRAALMSLRICGTYDNGCPDTALIDAINYAAAHGARVVNGSIAGGGPSQAVADALESHPNTLYVFAAGNDGANNDATPNYPCGSDQGAGYGASNLICVAATNQSDGRAGFSNYGASSVDLGAPGVNILSTSAQQVFAIDDFEVDDFATVWQNSAGNTQDWARSNEAPLTSFGVTDSPGADYGPNALSEVTSNPIALPPGYSSCELHYDRAINLASGDQFEIEVLLDTDDPPDGTPDAQDGVTFTQGNNSGFLLNRFFELNPSFDPGGELRVRLRLTSNGSVEANGVHMDNIKLICRGSPSDNGYEFLNGTSMATPMVTGAAALLFSDDPGATASQVKAELLDSVDPLPDLAATTVSGGRLNVNGALAGGSSNPASGGGGGGGGSATGGGSTTGTANQRPNTFFKRKPRRVVRTDRRRTRVVFRFGSSEADSGFRCRLDRIGYRPCSSRFVRRLLRGRHVLKVKAITSAGVIDPTAAVARFRVKRDD